MNKTRFFSLLFFILLMTTLAPMTVSLEVQNMEKPLVIVYLTDWRFQHEIKPEVALQIDQINYSFGRIVDGNLHVRHLHRWTKFDKLRQSYPHWKVYLSVGGWGEDGFSQAVSTPESREQFAESAIQVVRDWELDGLDWDWEFPGSSIAGIASSPHDRDHFTNFLLLMREKLDKLEIEIGKKLGQTVAVGAAKSFTEGYDIKKVVGALDHIGLMTYEMSRASSSHVANLYPSRHAPYSADQSMRAWMAAGVPRSKLMIGAAFFSHVFHGITAEAPGLSAAYGTKGTELGYDDWQQLILQGFERHWDEMAKAATWFNGHTLLSGDDRESMWEKGRYVVQEQLAGIIIWENNFNKSGEMLQALHKGFQGENLVESPEVKTP